MYSTTFDGTDSINTPHQYNLYPYSHTQSTHNMTLTQLLLLTHSISLLTRPSIYPLLIP